MPRFMMLMIPNIPTSDDWVPTAESVQEMTAYNEELVKAGVLLDGQGLMPPEAGFRVTFPAKGTSKITDGPFAEAKEVIGGYWIIQTKTREEAVEWGKRIPGDPSNIVEVRQIFEMEDFPEDVQAAAGHPRLEAGFLTDVERTIEAIWRIESARIIAGLARLVRDVGIAEDLAQEAFAAAVKQWPESGVPDNPGAWLMATAKRRAIDLVRRREMAGRKHEIVGREMEIEPESFETEVDSQVDNEVNDDLLRLVFISCHPMLSTEARVALTLRLLGGLTADEIARAFLVKEAAIQQRIVRAKRTLAEAGVPFEQPAPDELAERVGSVLEVIYLVFNEGYSATAGDDWMRPELCEDALRLGRILQELLPDEPEVHGLVALMDIQASRVRARTGPDGEPILLLDQDRARWDGTLIQHGLRSIERAQRTGRGLGPYCLQAAIAACHATAPTADATNWARIAALYDGLAQIAPSPIVELNRAVAVSMAFGPEAALEVVDRLAAEPALAEYHLLPSVRGDLLYKLDRFTEARDEFERAASLTRNGRERQLLLARAAACQWGAASA